MLRNVKDNFLGHGISAKDGAIGEIDVNWLERNVVVDLTRQAIRDAPAYDMVAPFDREREKALHAHYGHSGYWTARGVPDADAQSRKHGVL